MAKKEDLVMNGSGVEEIGFPGWPQFAPEVPEEVSKVLLSGKVNYWTGKVGMEFEEAFAKWTGAKVAVSCTNGTAALHIALASLGVGPGDEVIVPSYTFIASSFSVVQAGAIPVFGDVTEDHTLDPKCIEALITERTKAIVVVHLYGVVADMGAIMEIAKKHNLFVVEDCAQCIGGKYKDTMVGLVGDVGCYSFCQSKHFTTGGEGGMVITNNEDLAWECRSFRDHGYDVRTRMNMLALEEKLPYIHRRVGFNYRMTEMQSMIGLCELKRFDNWNLKRRFEYAAMYDKALTGLKGIKAVPVNTAERKNAYWWYPILLDLDVVDITAKEFIKELIGMGIPCSGILWPESYLEQAYQEGVGFGDAHFPFKSKEYTDPKTVDYSKVVCPVARSLRDQTVSLFLHPSWEKEHIEKVIEAIKVVIAKHSK